MFEFDDDHVTVPSGLPERSVPLANSCVWNPIGNSAGRLETVMCDGGGVTVTLVEPGMLLALVAVMLTTLPLMCPVTTPLASTDAAAGFALVHVNVVTTWVPFASFAVAVSARVPFTGTVVGLGVTVTVATGPAA